MTIEELQARYADALLAHARAVGERAPAVARFESSADVLGEVDEKITATKNAVRAANTALVNALYESVKEEEA